MRHPYATLLRAAAFAFVSMLASSPPASAADGDFMTNWGSSGRLLLQLSTFDDAASAIAAQRDGKLLLAGQCGMDANRTTLCAARLRADGQFDLGFGPNETGRILLNSVPELASYDSTLGLHGFALQSDGRAILGGSWICANWSGCKGGMLVRLDANGVVEPRSGYGIAYGYNEHYAFNSVNAVALAPDGKIVAAGCTVRADSDPPNYDFGIARFNPELTAGDASFGGNGARIGAFDVGGDQYDCATSVVVLPDRKIVAAGSTRGSDGRLKAALLKLNIDASADTAFGNNGRVWFDRGSLWSPGDIEINAITLDRRGRVVIAGSRKINDGTDQDFVVARLDATTGALDPTFSGGAVSIPFDLGAPLKDVANDVIVQGDGHILVAGEASAPNATSVFAVVRLNDDGSRDSSFGVGGKVNGSFSPPAQTANRGDAGRSMVLANGGLFLAGPAREQSGGGRFGIAKLQVGAIFRDGFER